MAKTIEDADFTGRELPGIDIEPDVERLTHESATKDLAALDQEIEQHLLKAALPQEKKEAVADPEKVEGEKPPEKTDGETKESPVKVDGEEKKEELKEDDPLADLKREVALEKIEREKLAAKLALSEAHASNLAGKLGHIEKQNKSAPRYQPEDDLDPDAGERSDDTIARVDRLEKGLSEDAIERQISGAARTVLPELSALMSEKDYPITKEDLESITKKYDDDFTSAREAGSPEAARLIATATMRIVLADAKSLRESRITAQIAKGKEERAKQAGARKIAAGSVAGKGSDGRAPAPKYDPVTVPLEDLDRMVREEYGLG